MSAGPGAPPPSGPPTGRPSGPPSGPPSGGPAWGQPPSAYGPPPGNPPGGWDHAQFGGGQQPQGRNGKKWAVGVGAVVAGALVVGGGAYAGVQLLSGGDNGPQPAEALPSSTFAYASIDLTKSGEAVKTLLKFPAFQQHVKLGAGQDVRETLVDAILSDQDSSSCGQMSWDSDFKPWLGNRAAVAGVDVSDKPVPVVVIEVTDAGKAKAEFDKLSKCSGDMAYTVSGDWALLGPKSAPIDQLAKDASSSSLADDSSYKKWTGEVGDQGAVVAYAAPKAGEMIASAFESYAGVLGGLSSGSASSGSGIATPPTTSAFTNPPTTDCSTDPYDPACQGAGPMSQLAQACPGLESDPTAGMGQLKASLQKFQGAAATLRFKNGGAEIEAAGDFGQQAPTGQDAGDVVGALPGDTAATIGLSLGDNWFDTVIQSLSSVCGPSFNPTQLESQLSQMTGLSFPGDINTLLGKGFALSLGGDFDPSSIQSPADIPAALTIKGDASAIQGVLDKIKAKIGNADQGMLDSDSKGDVVAVGPSSTYRSKVLGPGGLGSDSTFKDVVPHADGAGAIVFVDFDKFDDLVAKEAGPDALANFKPLKALGISAWIDGSTTHYFMRLSTD